MRFAEYQVSPKVVLKKGTKFRVADGPYWKTATDKIIPMRARGVMTFNFAFKDGRAICIDADSEKEGHVILHVRGVRKNKEMPEMVCRPYRVTGRVRSKK